MKAYIGGCHSDPDSGNIIVWARNSREAHMQVFNHEISDYADSYVDAYATRRPAFDDMENADDYEIFKMKWREGWLFVDVDTPFYKNTTDEEFDEWYEKEYGEWKGVRIDGENSTNKRS